MKRALSIVALVALAGCAGTPSPTPASSPPTTAGPTKAATAPPTPAAGGLLLRIDSAGGLAAPQEQFLRLPQVAVYQDGSLVTQGPMLELYPGPALPNLQVTRLSAAGVARIVELARAAGLRGPNRRLEAGGIADAPATVFTAVIDGERHVTTAVALATESGLTVPDGDLPARQALLVLQQAVGDMRSTPGAVVGDDAPYQWSALRVVVTTQLPPDDGIQAQILGWPLPTPLAEFGAPVAADPNLRCGVLEGDDLARVQPLLAKANQLTRWQSGPTKFQLLLRPLLPDESGCTAEPAG
jgi:hypothetical protein